MKPVTKKPLKAASQRPASKKPMAPRKAEATTQEPKSAPQETHTDETATPAPVKRTSLRALALAVADDFTAGRSMLNSAAALAAFLAKPAKGDRKPREITAIQQKFLDLCGRPEGATAKELADAAGWPSIAARTTLQKLADREGYTLSETPRTKERAISFRLTKKAEILFA